MNNPLWTSVDNYIGESLIASDPALEAALLASEKAGLPPIQVSPSQGKLLHLMAKACGARNILEIGTLGGYSTIWLARALPAGGQLVTLEADPKHAEVAQVNLARAGLADVVEVRLGLALDSLPRLIAEKRSPFDFIFIDADKPSCADYFALSLKLSRVGTVIITDNVVRNGGLVDATSTDVNIQGVRRLHEMLATESRVSATTLQTVGCKGYDGFCFAVVVQV
jgi:predicted O-methyltransferase YrrM